MLQRLKAPQGRTELLPRPDVFNGDLHEFVHRSYGFGTVRYDAATSLERIIFFDKTSNGIRQHPLFVTEGNVQTMQYPSSRRRLRAV